MEWLVERVAQALTRQMLHSTGVFTAAAPSAAGSATGSNSVAPTSPSPSLRSPVPEDLRVAATIPGSGNVSSVLSPAEADYSSNGSSARGSNHHHHHNNNNNHHNNAVQAAASASSPATPVPDPKELAAGPEGHECQRELEGAGQEQLEEDEDEKDEDEDEALIEALLPTEIMLEIFGFLHTMPQLHTLPFVNRRWRDICALLIGRRLDLSDRITAWTVDDHLLHAIARSFPNLREIDLSNAPWVSEAGLQALAHGCPQLRKLAMRGVLVGVQKMRAIANMPMLKELDVSGKVDGSGYYVDVHDVENFAPSLEVLNAGLLQNLAFAALTKPEPDRALLHTLELQQPPNELLIRLCEFPSLRELILHRCEHIPVFNVHIPSLQTLHLDRCSLLVRRLDVRQPPMPHMAFVDLFEQMPALQELRLENLHRPQLDDHVLAKIAEIQTSLVALVVKGQTRLSDDFICAAAEHMGARLVKLELSVCAGVSDVGLHALAKHCGQLQTLALPMSQQLTDEGVAALAAGCPRLASLNLARCPLLTEFAFSSLASMRNLKEVILFGSHTVGAYGKRLLSRQGVAVHYRPRPVHEQMAEDEADDADEMEPCEGYLELQERMAGVQPAAPGDAFLPEHLIVSRYPCACEIAACGRCGVEVKACARNDHQRICSSKARPCPSCGQPVRTDRLAMHYARECEGYLVVCWCKAVHPRYAAAAHMATHESRGLLLPARCPLVVQGCLQEDPEGMPIASPVLNHLRNCPMWEVKCPTCDAVVPMARLEAHRESECDGPRRHRVWPPQRR